MTNDKYITNYSKNITKESLTLIFIPAISGIFIFGVESGTRSLTNFIAIK
jgi:hypothetical protein